MGNLLTDLGAERLASQLAPFLMGHVGEHFALMPGGGLMIITSSYNDFTCTKYVEGLGDSVLENAERFSHRRLCPEGRDRIARLDPARGCGEAEQPSLRSHDASQEAHEGSGPRHGRAVDAGQQCGRSGPSGATVDGIADRMIKAIQQEKARRAAP